MQSILKIPTPPIEIQNKIVNELDKIEDSIKTIETRIIQLKIEKELYQKYIKNTEICGLITEQFLNQFNKKINNEKEYIKELKSLGKHIMNSFCD